MNRTFGKWIMPFAAVIALATSTMAAQQITANENTTNKVQSTRSRSAKIDLNTASREQLESLPGVGATTANAIIAARPFKTVNDLKDVKGIGETRFEEIKPHVTVRSTASRSSTTSSGAPGASASSSGTGGGDKPTQEAQSKNVTPAGSRRADGVGSTVSTDPVHSGSDKPGAREKENSRVPSSARSDNSSARRGAKVNLNTASKSELEALPGIGPVKAQAIIDNRPYTSPEDVMKVKGIKQGTYDEIRDQITVR